MHRLLLAKSGWGKSWYAQAVLEVNIPKYDLSVVLDPKDEYRGLVKAGYAKHWIVGPAEANWSAETWEQFFRKNPRVILAQYRIGEEDWRDVAVNVTRAVRRLCRSGHTGFLAFDEGHQLAPQHGVPEELKNLGTTGRGEGVSSLWITQRAALLDETVIGQCGERVLGGFTSDADLNKLRNVTEYPTDIHNPNTEPHPSAPEALHIDGEAIPLRKFKESGSLVGSEWIYSDDDGALERRNTQNVSMDSTHHGPEGEAIADP